MNDDSALGNRRGLYLTAALAALAAMAVNVAYVAAFYLFGRCGGLLALAWFLLTALRFFSLSRAPRSGGLRVVEKAAASPTSCQKKKRSAYWSISTSRPTAPT